MKFWLTCLSLAIILCGCGKTQSELDKAMLLRERIIAAEACTFDANITADYADEIYAFGMHCSVDTNGDVHFLVTDPDVISGIEGVLTGENGSLTFDNQILAFEMLADGQLTPVSGPWIMIRGIRNGYVHCGNKEDNGYYLQIDDSFKGSPVTIELWLDESYLPTGCEIIWEGRRLLSITVSNFTIL